MPDIDLTIKNIHAQAASNAQDLSDGRKRGQGDLHGAPCVTDQRFVRKGLLTMHWSVFRFCEVGLIHVPKGRLRAEEVLRGFWVGFNVGFSQLFSAVRNKACSLTYGRSG